MKVIFLDVDGVLNFAGTEAKTPNGCMGIADTCVKKLKQIIDETNAFIVLISTWKREWNMDVEKCLPNGKYLVKKLDRRGLHIMDKTEDHIDDRGRGIADWLKRHPNVTDWVVLDDEVFDDYASFVPIDKRIITSFVMGLTDDDVQNAIKILGGK